MERLQAVLKRKKAARRSRSRSKDRKKKKKRRKRSESYPTSSEEANEPDETEGGQDEEAEKRSDSDQQMEVLWMITFCHCLIIFSINCLPFPVRSKCTLHLADLQNYVPHKFEALVF